VVAVLVERVGVEARHGQRSTHLAGEDLVAKALRGKDFVAVPGDEQRVAGGVVRGLGGADEHLGRNHAPGVIAGHDIDRGTR
jgi:hypothetical protein